MCGYNIKYQIEIRWVRDLVEHSPLSHSILCFYVLCNIVISSLVHHVRPDDGLIEKGPKHVVYLLTPYTLIKFCCVLTYPPYINLIFDIM